VAAKPAHDERFGKPSALRVHGYPVIVGSGMAAVAVRAGFTRDGETLGVCWSDGGSESLHCRFVDRREATRDLEIPFLYGKGVPMYAIDESNKDAMWLAEQAVPKLVLEGPAAWDLRAPPIKGMWRFARDIELHLVEVKEDRKRGQEAELRVGGSVRGRDPVFPITIRRPIKPPPYEAVPPNAVHFIRPNYLGLSPDASELGLIVHSAQMEYDSTYTIHRWPVEEVAAQIYSATAEAVRAGGGPAEAARLCTLALHLRKDAACGLPPGRDAR
jgi:hypothetical protein